MINHATLALIKEFEGFRSKAYRDPVGIWTIGYGTTAAADVGISPKAGMVIDEAQAEIYLMRAVEKFAAAIRPKITQRISDNEFGAFVSLAYNIGPGRFLGSSALRHFNAGDRARAADAILAWNKAGGKMLPGLARRRTAERALFLTPVEEPAAPPVAVPPALAPVVGHRGGAFLAILIAILTPFRRLFGGK